MPLHGSVYHQYKHHAHIMIQGHLHHVPQTLMSRVLECDTNYSTIEVTWDPPDNDSRVDSYHYQVVVDLDATNHSYTLSQYSTTTTTTNTTVTVVLVIFLNCGDVHIILYNILSLCY